MISTKPVQYTKATLATGAALLAATAAAPAFTQGAAALVPAALLLGFCLGRLLPKAQLEELPANHSEDQLRKFSWAVEQSPTIVVITDTTGQIEYVNRKFEEVTGYSREEVLGGNPHLLKSGVMPDETYQEMWDTLTAGEEWRGELQNRKKNGDVYWEAATVSPIKDDTGKVSHYIALMEDVTESRALALALNHAQKMEALGTLTGGVAHDFNNILTAIIGYANLIQMKLPAGDPSMEFLDKVVRAAEKAASLTRGLLTYSRSHSINPAPVDLNRLVARVSKLIDRVIGDEVTLVTSVAGEPLTIYADSGQLEQILMNLARNGAEAMSGKGTLTIATDEYTLDEAFLKRCGFGVAGRYARLRVSDCGPGLDEKTRERIFEPFFTTHGVGRGPGLGLSIVYGIVKQHKGYIEVESALGQGSTFTVYFPLLPTPVPKP
ncbi:two-component system sensor histidine kinase NtrB [Geomesophilobacter sediminis]|uniref:histidine kinase n=1 Tax=Geomesophilobacter sediminis TaxID=2798584 RepID=A0A8J7M0E1_9BACT|nr:PAS domain S-box protein [Geomesophilobacter sediminis]MBJ6724707.1 PAS domain S-box protein [Geomesophilobacter sediminis]